MSAQLGRPLGHPGDRWLLQLERVRILDTTHSWADSTIAGHQTQLRKVSRFERAHPGLAVLERAKLPRPPTGQFVTLAWVELDASVRSLPPRGTLLSRNPAFDSVRRIRSAVSAFSSLDVMQSDSNANFFDRGTHRRGRCIPTDTGGFTLFSKGLSARIGSNPRPSTALLGRHVTGIESWLEARHQSSHGTERHQNALAGLAHCFLWLGWLRGGEAFGILQSDVSCVLPTSAAECDLPLGVGAIIIHMAQDKTHRSTSQELVIACRCLTGLSAGEWLRRVISHSLWDPDSAEPLFRQPNGTVWSSHFFRHRFLCPALAHLRAQGDPFLSRFDGSSRELTLAYVFWSLHSCRRGARTHCQRSNPDRRHHKATKAQVCEHARWQLQGPPCEIDAVHRDWTLCDKLKITPLCH